MDKFIVSLPKLSLSSPFTTVNSSALSSKKRKAPGSTSVSSQNSKRRAIIDSCEKENVVVNSEDQASGPSSLKKVQMYLDFGQKSLLETVQCPHCDLLFRSHDLDDLKQHQQYCKERLLPPQFSSNFLLKGQILNEFPHEKEKIFFLSGRGKKLSPHRTLTYVTPPSSEGKPVKTFSRKDSSFKPWVKEESQAAIPMTPGLVASEVTSPCLIKLEEMMTAEFGLSIVRFLNSYLLILVSCLSDIIRP